MILIVLAGHLSIATTARSARDWLEGLERARLGTRDGGPGVRAGG